MISILKRIAARALATLSLFGAILMAPAVQAQEHIAAVNSDRILRESVPAIAAQARITQEFSKRQADIDGQTAKLRDMASALDRASTSGSEPQRAQKQQQLAQMDLDIKRKRRELDEDLNQRRNEELQSVLERANRAIKQIAEKDHYDLIIQEAVFVNPKIDITDKVLKALAAPQSAN